MSRKIAALARDSGGQDWRKVEQSLDANGYGVLPNLLSAAQCDELASMYRSDQNFRTRIVMARHGFGSGEYKYFPYPLPSLIEQLRTSIYSHLAPIANRWNQLMGLDVSYPSELSDFLKRCHVAGQGRPTPLLLQYVEGDYNCLHQDLYGEHIFPLQVAILLARPYEDFTGGEFVMTEAGSKAPLAAVVPLRQGDAVVFTVNQRPVLGVRATRKVAMRHGVSRIRSGNRHTLGLIFHDSC